MGATAEGQAGEGRGEKANQIHGVGDGVRERGFYTRRCPGGICTFTVRSVRFIATEAAQVPSDYAVIAVGTTAMTT